MSKATTSNVPTAKKSDTKAPDAAPDSDAVLPYPNMDVVQYLFTLNQPSLSHLHESARSELLRAVEADGLSSHLTDQRTI